MAKEKDAGKPAHEYRDKKDKKDGKKPAKPAFHSKQVSKMTGEESKDFKGIVRLAGKDLDGHLSIRKALMRIRGIGHNLAASLSLAATSRLNLDLSMPAGELSEEKLEELENFIKNPSDVIMPFLLNRQSASEVEKSKHLISTDLVFAVTQDIQRQKDVRSYIGWRHSLGQKVRGQRNRTTGRSGMTVGVLKKALKQAAGGDKKEEKK